MSAHLVVQQQTFKQERHIIPSNHDNVEQNESNNLFNQSSSSVSSESEASHGVSNNFNDHHEDYVEEEYEEVDQHENEHDEDAYGKTNDEDYDEYEDEEEDEGDLKRKTPNRASMTNGMGDLYKQNCLAAAQMLQLMTAAAAAAGNTNASLSTSTSSLISANSGVNYNSSDSATTSPPHQGNVKLEALNNGTSTSSDLNEKENIPICKYCQKIFANFSNLNHHISAIHLNQSKWVCSQCGKICSSKSNLKVHLRVHLRVKPYHCRWCSYSCMHHSSIRDHLAKVHPDQTHTPLQPGYLFNSQAVPEPEVFNSVGFNVSSFQNDSKMNLEESASESPRVVPPTQASEKQRAFKKCKIDEASIKQETQARSPQNKPNIITPTPISAQQNYLLSQSAQMLQQNSSAMSYDMSNAESPNSPNVSKMSNLYNTYAMARMFPFMYHPSLLGQPQQQPSVQSPFLGMLNQNLTQQQHQSRSNSFLTNLSSMMSHQQYKDQQASVFNSYLLQNSLASSSGHSSQIASNSSASSSSDELNPTNNSSNLSGYSTSSRSSSLSPTNKATSELISMITTSTSLKNEASNDHLNRPTETVASNVRKTLTIDQMLNNTKVTKESQTETNCINCPHCHKQISL